jgi:hypothetical protein
MNEPGAGTALSAVLQRLAEDEGERVSIGDLLAALDFSALAWASCGGRAGGNGLASTAP